MVMDGEDMQIQINDIKSYRSPDAYSVTYDDRQTRIELLNGNTVQDAGRFISGDTLSVTAVFRRVDFNAIVALWEARQIVNFTDEAGVLHQNVRLKLNSYKYETRFPDYVTVTFEVWKC